MGSTGGGGGFRIALAGEKVALRRLGVALAWEKVVLRGGAYLCYRVLCSPVATVFFVGGIRKKSALKC